MDREGAFLTLLQITDSFFPSGSFAYSWGLEAYVQEGIIRDQKGLGKFLRAYLTGFIARCDALILRFALEASEKEDLETIFCLDRRIHSMKLAKELREGSMQTGRQLLKVMGELKGLPIFDRFAAGIKTGRAWGHHPVVFGIVCGVLGIGKEETVLAYLYQTVSAIVSAGVRLIPLGHMDGQRAMEGIKPEIQRIAGDLRLLNEGDLSSFAPGLEIRAMKHEHLYMRLFKA